MEQMKIFFLFCHDRKGGIPRKRWLSACLFCLLIVCLSCSCQVRDSRPEEWFNYPGLTWGMTPEEVLSALHLTEDQVEIDEYGSSYDMYYSPQTEVFGQKPDTIVFRFGIWGSMKNLSYIVIAYPGNNEEIIQSLMDGISRRYGPLQDTVVLGTDSSVFSGADNPPSFSVFHNDDSDDEFIWVSEKKFADAFTQEQKQTLQTLMTQPDSSFASLYDPTYWSNPDYFAVYQQTNPAAKISLLSKKEGYEAYLNGDGCSIRMDARNMVGIRQFCAEPRYPGSSESSSELP